MSPPRILCDEMLTGLGRWLRAAGYDALIAAPGTADRVLLKQALAEDRLLITRDRKLMEMRHAAEVALLISANELEDCIAELNQALAIDWQLAPFSRCLLCNMPLELADHAICQRVPADVQAVNTQILYCPRCDKAYWQGSHTTRMAIKLAAFKRLGV